MAKGGKSVEEVVEEIAQPIVGQHGLELVDIELVKEGANLYLRVYIDKEGGVSFDDCEAVSRAVDSRLNEILPNPPYEYFEVCSPGLERPLKHENDFARYAGRKVAVSTYAPVDGQKLFVGELVGLIDGQIVVRVSEGAKQGQVIALDRQKVASTKLRVDF